MLKLVSIFLIVMYSIGGCNMANVYSNTGSEAENQSDLLKKIREHAGKNFSLPADKITVDQIDLKDLPAGMKQYYVEEKDVSHGKSFNYIFWDERLYCSGIEGDFGRFLKDNKFLERKDLDEAWFRTMVWKFYDFRDQLLIGKEDLSKSDPDLAPFVNKISPPVMSKNDNEAAYKFYTQSVTVRPVQKFEITVNPDYKVNFNREFVSP